VILRHDRSDADCLVDEASWPTIVTFFGGDGAGTLIADRWLLTAAHTARNIPPDHQVAVAGHERRIVGVVVHPGDVDLALIELEDPIDGLTPMALHEHPDEVGAEALLLGRGDFGNGVDGVLGSDRRLRCVTNRVDAVDDRWLRLRFDPPPDCTRLEGVGGEGDSGGPALLHDRGRLILAGVSSWQDHDGPLGTYGCVEHYARVCTRVDWIRATIARSAGAMRR
jgi:Trypsin